MIVKMKGNAVKKKNKNDLTAMFHRLRVFASGVCG